MLNWVDRVDHKGGNQQDPDQLIEQKTHQHITILQLGGEYKKKKPIFGIWIDTKKFPSFSARSKRGKKKTEKV